MRKSPILVVSPTRYARAAAYGVAAAVVGGAAWALLSSFGGFGGLSALLVVGLGYLVGEAVSRGSDGRISRGLMGMAGILTVISVLVGRVILLLGRMPSGFPLDARLQAALSLSIGSLLGLTTLLFLVLAVIVAISRVR